MNEIIRDNIVHIYTDGACSGNPGPGGWGAVMLYNGVRKELAAFEPYTTNNKMELGAALAALNALKNKKPYTIHLYSDSQYLINGMNSWLAAWKKKGWRTTKGPVMNRELWEALDKLNQLYNIKWFWVKGHSNNEHNNRCDYLANEQIRLNTGY
jgi:ribonuclease HI